VLPGSKAVRSDRQWLADNGWDAALARHVRYGGRVIGLCGGYQMLGRSIADPAGREGEPGTSAGLGLLDVATELGGDKRLVEAAGELARDEGAAVRGYEIHIGETIGPDRDRPALHLAGAAEGAVSADGQVLGTYLHGLFEAPEACGALLRWAGLAEAEGMDADAAAEDAIDRLADALEAGLDADLLGRLTSA